MFPKEGIGVDDKYEENKIPIHNFLRAVIIFAFIVFLRDFGKGNHRKSSGNGKGRANSLSGVA